jgi:hypothetical protein
MHSKTELIHLFIVQYRYIKMINCIGCKHNKPSQKHHITCLTDVDRDFYIMKTLAYMLNRKLIDDDEFKYLNATYTTNMDQATFTLLESIKSIEINQHGHKETSSL